MKKFLKTLLIYIVMVGSITLAINYLYIYKGGNTGEEWEKFKYIPKQIEICNLGSSHGAHGFYYKDLEKNHICFNMALDAQTFSYDKRVLEAYKENLKPGGVVIVEISYFDCWGISETQYVKFESKNKRYYNFLPANLIKEYDLYTDIMIHRLPALNAGAGSVMSTLFSPKKPLYEPKSYPEMYRVVDVSKLKEDVQSSCKRHIFTNKRDENGELYFNEEEIQALRDIVQICRENSVTPIFVTVPYLREYTNEIAKEDSDFYEKFYGWVHEMSKELDVDYFDYSLDERFTNSYDLFYNGDHLNSNGARKFTNILYEEVLKESLK